MALLSIFFSDFINWKLVVIRKYKDWYLWKIVLIKVIVIFIFQGQAFPLLAGSTSNAGIIDVISFIYCKIRRLGQNDL